VSVEHHSNPVVPAFLEAYPGALSSTECEAIIRRFEADPRKFSSRTQYRLVSPIRSGIMLPTTDFPEWRDITDRIEAIVRGHLKSYAAKYVSLKNLSAPGNFYVSGALIEKIEPGQGYGFHIDAGPWGTQDRFLATLIYLQDVHEGGFTEFPYQSLRVAPRAGLMLMFPPYWTHLHRGAPPVSGTKYNITNFVCTKPSGAKPMGVDASPI
jgi:hypothetical protein